MKKVCKYISAILCLVMILSLSCFASADNEAEQVEVVTVSELSADGKAAMDWDDIVANLLRAYDTDQTHVSIGYKNLKTGEEHYLNGDSYFVAAGMYKLPLTMYVAQGVKNGSIVWDSGKYGVDFAFARDEVLLSSGNDWSDVFFSFVGGYDSFRKLTADYVGENTDDNLTKNYVENKYSAKNFINCLSLLYNEQDNFPGVIETLKTNEPERFFNLNGLDYDVAQKYGYVSDEYGTSYMNNCGLIFTSQPIALVVHTRSVSYNEDLIAEYAEKMCEYTEYMAANPTVQATPQPTEQPAATAAPTDVQPVEPAKQDSPLGGVSLTELSVAVFAVIGVFALLSVIKLFSYKRRYGAKIFWMFVSMLLCVMGMLTAVMAPSLGTVYANTKGDPSTVTAEFFNSIMEKNYDEAYSKLRDYSDLGLEIEPTTEVASIVNKALRSSYSYELTAPAQVDKLSAVQSVRLQFMDITLAQEDIHSAVNRHIEEIVKQRDVKEIYDSEKNYLPEVTQEVYVMAVNTVMEHPEKYYTTVNLNLQLEYVNNKWMIVADPILLKALNGNAGY